MNWLTFDALIRVLEGNGNSFDLYKTKYQISFVIKSSFISRQFRVGKKKINNYLSISLCVCYSSALSLTFNHRNPSGGHLQNKSIILSSYLIIIIIIILIDKALYFLCLLIVIPIRTAESLWLTVRRSRPSVPLFSMLHLLEPSPFRYSSLILLFID